MAVWGLAWGIVPRAAAALDVSVTSRDGTPLAAVMVTATPVSAGAVDRRDHGYPPAGAPWTADRWVTAFTSADGSARLDLPAHAGPHAVRLRHPGLSDLVVPAADPLAHVAASLVPLLDPRARADVAPANVWASVLDLGTPDLTRNFRMQCGFCHQQGTPVTRAEQPEEYWRSTLERMVRYGSRLSSEARRQAPGRLRAAWQQARAHPERLPASLPWDGTLAGTRIEEWPLGDGMSQMHDMLVHPGGRVYVGDNLQDRLYEVDPATGRAVVFPLPHEASDRLGGLFAARLAAFPRHQTYLSLHSLAVSGRDGHLFLTPSTQRRMVEFDPGTQAFTVHRLKDGLYPHTVRIDRRDRVWFTLALSNQVGMIDRATGAQHFIDLPSRSLGEAVTIRLVPLFFELARHGFPLSRLPVDGRSSGAPLPYGIDVAPDGVVWVARLHANDLIRIDPEALTVRSIPVPALGPRRLRADAEGRLWITAFGDASILRFDPVDETFERHELPTLPRGTETPYSLNVDQERRVVWVTGTASDTLIAFHIDTSTWSVFPLPRRMSFTRDVEIARDGSVFTANGAFPAWQIEGGQPTLIHVTPPWASADARGVP